MDELMKILVRYRIAEGFLFAVVFLWLAKPGWWSILAGLLVSLMGAGMRTWASGHIDKCKKLTMTGPYSLVRNPLYLGSFFIGLGACIMGAHPGFTLIFLIFFVLVYRRKMADEELKLKEKYGMEYDEYKALVPGIIPLIARPEPGEGFDWKLVMHNREYQGWLGLLVVVAVLAVKAALNN